MPDEYPYPDPGDIASHRMGGHLRDIPWPHQRKFPRPNQKRTVTVSLLVYGAGHHTYIDIVERSNPIWDDKEKCWTDAWDDKEGKGLTFHGRFEHGKDATRWMRRILNKHFSRKTHLVEPSWDAFEDAKPQSWYWKAKPRARK